VWVVWVGIYVGGWGGSRSVVAGEVFRVHEWICLEVLETCARAHTDTHTYTHARTHTLTCTHTRTHAYAHTHIHTHAHKHTHTLTVAARCKGHPRDVR